jgi:TolB-like protein/Flp pilus assembly protein TadD
MKFVEGGQLDEVGRNAPMSIRQAAELVAKVARTVHYAHEHGILHRDIKPGNILLDAKGEPHLTDFGLARLVESESTVTRTLEVLGTPSYMAPEQAAGEHTKLGKATDVYGLGAVLYQLLTGQPPFAGGTTYETIRLLLETEPRPPRLLNPKIDRDLSTICLKCLEKDPSRRYSSALALAEDLEHWLKHEPIRAKPSGFLTHGRKWVRRNPSTTVLVTLLVALAAGLSVTVWNRKPAVIIPKSVAVLPFENLSDDPDNAYFAQGIQEEILTRLAKIADLKVISRTSTQTFKGKPHNLAQIAKQLGVANIVEGSVQKTADQARVNVQLINAQTDSHLWADTYDRKLSDIFGVESEIANAIAESLQARLTGQEQQALAVKPTNNPEAYDAYLRGLAFEARAEATTTSWSPDLARKAIGFYERAVQLDPNFAVAWARLSPPNARLYYSNLDRTPARRDAAKRALESAQKLEPNSPETLVALGYYQCFVLGDFNSAKTTFARISKMLPGSSEVPRVLGRIARREGKWDESIAYFEQGLALDPRNPELLNNAAQTFVYLRQFPAALKLYDRALDITPNDPELMGSKAAIYQAQGNLEEAAKLLVDINPLTGESAFFIKVTQLGLERNLAEAVRFRQVRQAQFHFDSEYAKGVNQVWLALAQRLAGDIAGAKVSAEQGRKTFAQLDKDQPENPTWVMMLSQAYALLGEKDLAIGEAERAVMLVPRAKDPLNGPGLEENLAFIQALVGDHGRAISGFARLLQTPYIGGVYESIPITPALLRLDPTWDPLRSDPAFQKLCEEKIDKSIAVLPFENLSADPNNAYFAEGIQEEILTRLAKIADLKVISRASTQQYQSKPRDLGQIAKQLGVANILEGSVQKAADQVRVNVRLINAQTDSHLWAESYDRRSTDILSVESEIAKRVAESLQAKLSGREEQALAAKPTNNVEAYDAYLRGLAYEARSYQPFQIRDLVVKAAGFYERAVQADPDFAIAWARLSRADAQIYFNRIDVATAARGDAAKRALENAQKLDPNSPETLLALGYYEYRVRRDFELAKATFRRVGKLLPGSSEVPYALALITRREGHWDESIAYFEQALALDSRNAEFLTDAARTYAVLRQFPAALKLYDRVLDITPNDTDVMAAKATIYQAQGNLQEAARFLSEINQQTPSGEAFNTKLTELRLQRNYGEAIRLLQTRQDQFHFASPHDKGFEQVWLAFMQRLAGDTAGAKVTAEQARDTLKQLDSNQPQLWTIPSLSQAYALAGEKDSAVKLAEQAIALLPSAKDPAEGPTLEENLAFIQMIVGENGRAISILSQLLQKPYSGWFYGAGPITRAHLRLDPFWDPLRSDPAFQKLCEETQPPAAP